VTAVLLGALLGLMFSRLQPTLYEGVASVLLDNGASQVEPGGDPDRALQNQVNVMTSTEVLDRVANESGTLSVADLRQRVTVEAAQASDMISVRALDPTPKGAADLANAVVLAYRDEVTEELRDKATVARKRAEAEEANLRQQLAELGPSGGDSQDAARLTEIQTVRDRLRTVLAEQLRLRREAQTAAPSGIRVERAEVPGQPAQPKRLRNMAGGALLLLFVGVGVAWTLAVRRPTSTELATTPTALPRTVERSRILGQALSAERPSSKAAANGSTLRGTRQVARTENGGPARASMLTPELIVAFDRLASSLEEAMDALRIDGWSVAEQTLPQVEAEKLAAQFGLGVVVILLDDEMGRLKVAGGVGLTPVERHAAVRYDPELLEEVFAAGPRLVMEDERTRFADVGIPGGLAESLLLIPLVHGDEGFGLLLASPRANGSQPAVFSHLQVEGLTALTRVIVPSLWSWVLLGRLKLRIRQEG
jgi:capsular polysaccharide biosynthesis protein